MSNGATSNSESFNFKIINLEKKLGAMEKQLGAIEKQLKEIKKENEQLWEYIKSVEKLAEIW